jgi:hypothetical protein
MNLYAKILSLSYDSAEATKSIALKSHYRSVRLMKDVGYLNPKQPSYVTNVLLCGNCIDATTRNLYVFYIDTFYDSAWIIEINIDNHVQTVVYYDKYNVIGFDPLHKIYNAKVVFGRLVWAEYMSPIYQMDIARAKRSFYYKIGYGQYPNITEWDATVVYDIEQIVSAGKYFYKSLVYNNINNKPQTDDGTNWISLCMIEEAYYSMNVENFYFEPMPPKHPPVVEYYSDVNRQVNNLKQTLFQIAYRYVYMDWRKSTFSPASIIPMPNSEEETATGLADEDTTLNNVLQITVNTGGEEVRQIEIVGRSSDDPSKWYLIDTINKFSEEEQGTTTSTGAQIKIVSCVVNATNVTMGITINAPSAVGLSIINSGFPNTLAISINAPNPIDSWVAVSLPIMTWLAAECILTNSWQSSIITCPPTECQLNSFPSWITVEDNLGNSLSVGSTILTGGTIKICPTDAYTDTVNDRSGFVVLKNVYNDSASIRVTQYKASTSPPPPPTTFDVSKIYLNPDDVSGLIIYYPYGFCTAGSAIVNLTLVPYDTAHSYGETLTIYWKATKNSLWAGNGNFTASYSTNNSIQITLTSYLDSADVIVIELCSFYI